MEAVSNFLRGRFGAAFARLPAIYILLLLLLVGETFYILSREVDQSARNEALKRYPAADITFPEPSLDALNSLSPETPVPKAQGRGNPFVP